MQIKIESDQPTIKKLTVDFKETEMTKTRQRVEKKLALAVKIDGFRKGKAPIHLALKNIDSQLLYKEFLTVFVPLAVQQALEKEDLNPVVPPEVSVTKFVPYSELQLVIVADVLNIVKLADYKKITKTLPQIRVDEPEIKAILKKLQLDLAQYKEINRACKLDDRVLIDFDGYDKDDQLIRGTSDKDYWLILGSQTLIPGFESNLVGHEAPKKVEFEIRFPKDYKPQKMANQLVKFKVNLKKVQQVILPKLDDEFAAKIQPDKTFKELKELIVNQVKEDKKRQAYAVLQGEIVGQLAQDSQIEIPLVLIDKELEKLKQEHTATLKRNNLSLKDWLEDMDLSEEAHLKKLREAALNRLKGGLVLREITHLNKITVSEEEVLQVLSEQTNNQKLSQDQIKDLKQDIYAQLLSQKTINHLSQTIIKE